MTRLVVAELLKLRTTRSWLGMLGLMAAFVTMNAVMLLALAGVELGGEPGLPALSDPDMRRATYGSAAGGVLFVLLLGVLGMTTEYRHQTITRVFLYTPRRGRVVAAKLTAYFFAGACFGLVADLVTLVLVLPGLAVRGQWTSPGGDVAAILAGTVLASALYALVGLGLGALIRNQVAAIVLAVAWTQVVEGILVVALPRVGEWLPGGAVQAIAHTTGSFGGSGIDIDLLPAWGGALLLLAYGVVFATIAALTTVRRDVT